MLKEIEKPSIDDIFELGRGIQNWEEIKYSPHNKYGTSYKGLLEDIEFYFLQRDNTRRGECEIIIDYKKGKNKSTICCYNISDEEFGEDYINKEKEFRKAIMFYEHILESIKKNCLDKKISKREREIINHLKSLID